jgi:sigma-B regulation protein RsbU (phosphoserine phosphatase)
MKSTNEETVDHLLIALGQAFDLGVETAHGSLGDAIRNRLMRIDISESPRWGSHGPPSQVAKLESENLDFYYRPHLFPEMEPELRLAHHLQFDLLPRALPRSMPLEIAAVLESYCHLSGDLLGWREEEGRFLLWIADVSGHGVRAGLAAAVLRFLIDGMDFEAALSDILKHLNDQMLEARNPHDKLALYTTIFMLDINPDGRVHYASAGHPPMLLRRADGQLLRLEGQNPPVGLLPDLLYQEAGCSVQEGDCLFLYTDGLLEAGAIDDNDFGLDRIEDLVRPPLESPLSLSRRAYSQVMEHKGSTLLEDDLTFLAARFRSYPMSSD